MIKVYIIKYENEIYSIKKINISPEFIDALKSSDKNIIEEVRKNEIKIKFVGILSYKSEILIILPKYLVNNNFGKKNLMEKMKKLIKVFKKLPKSLSQKYKDALFIKNDIDDSKISEIAIADFLIKDYINNGIIEKVHEKRFIGKNEKIDWNSTINQIVPYKNGKNIVYLDTIIKKKVSNNKELITLIHKFVIDILINKYGKILDINKRTQSIYELKKMLKTIGNEEYILKIIEKEMQKTYMDREIFVLRALYNYFSNINDSETENYELYGTKDFNIIWEELCSNAFADQYEIYSKFIQPPIWKTLEGIEYEAKRNKLEPDVLRSYKNKVGVKYFLIIDAKYYSIKLNNKKNNIHGQPTSYDIVKQFAYQFALDNIIKKHHKSYNIFLFPKMIERKFRFFGTVNLKFFEKSPIVNYFISPDYLINLYLRNMVISRSDINSFIREIDN